MAWGKSQANTFWDGMDGKQAMIVLQGMPWCLLDLCKEVRLALPKYHIDLCTLALVLTILKSREKFYKIKKISHQKKVFKIGSHSEKV